MKDVAVKFEREDLEGIVAVGTYIKAAAGRFGIRFQEECDAAEDVHHCAVEINHGEDLLSSLTTAEKEYFDKNGRTGHERLACQAKFDLPGEAVIMTKEKTTSEKDEKASEDRAEQYRKEFAEMPLEAKIANLVQLEAIALGETVSFIANSPFKVFDKLMDVMAEFGFKKEESEKEAAKPQEHKQQKGKAKRPHSSKTEPKDSVKDNGQV